MILRVRVQDGGDKVNINLPLPLIKIALEMGMNSSMGLDNVNIGKVNLSAVDFGRLIKLVEAGVVGKLIEVEGSSGETVVIEVC
jgi:hypothetical protein